MSLCTNGTRGVSLLLERNFLVKEKVSYIFKGVEMSLQCSRLCDVVPIGSLRHEHGLGCKPHLKHTYNVYKFSISLFSRVFRFPCQR